MRTLTRWMPLVPAIIFAIVASIGCAARSTSAALDDATITTRVKTAILKDPEIGGRPIDVDTVKAVVTLSGRVNTQSERDRALALARAVAGVAEVKDTLRIQPDGG